MISYFKINVQVNFLFLPIVKFVYHRYKCVELTIIEYNTDDVDIVLKCTV